jgi:hypothetical protein
MRLKTRLSWTDRRTVVAEKPQLSGVWNNAQRAAARRTDDPTRDDRTTLDDHLDFIRILEAHERLLRAEMEARFLAEVERDTLRAIVDRLLPHVVVPPPAPPDPPAEVAEPVPAPLVPKRGGWSRPKSVGLCRCGEVFERYHPLKKRCDKCKRADHSLRQRKPTSLDKAD